MDKDSKKPQAEDAPPEPTAKRARLVEAPPADASAAAGPSAAVEAGGSERPPRNPAGIPVQYIPNMPRIPSRPPPVAVDGYLDLSALQLTDLEGYTVPTDLVEIDLTENRLREWPPEVVALDRLERVSVRKNLFKDAAAVGQFRCKGTLKELVMHDNLLGEMPSLEGFSSLEKFDFSFNEIKEVGERVRTAEGSKGTMKEIYFASNKIAAIPDLSAFASLRSLEMGSNRIRAIEGLASAAALRELWLGRNRISQITGVEGLTGLQKLSLQANRLESMVGLGACTALEELYLSQNGITRIEGLEGLTRLRILDLAHNRLARVEGLQDQKHLTDLWVNDNRIDDLDHLGPALAAQRFTVTVVYLEGNPCSKAPGYRAKVMEFLPNLCQLDADTIER